MEKLKYNEVVYFADEIINKLRDWSSVKIKGKNAQNILSKALADFMDILYQKKWKTKQYFGQIKQYSYSVHGVALCRRLRQSSSLIDEAALIRVMR